MTTFHLQRNDDVSGVSGVGVVAQGCVFDNGIAVMTWIVKGKPSSVGIYPSLKAIKEIHGHDGATRIVVHPRAGAL